MREESHLEDMRSAIRGDFERLEERRGRQDLMRVPEDEVPPGQEAEPEQVPEPEPAPEESSQVEPARRSWLDRLLGR